VLLREMEGEGLLVRKRRAVRRTATLPAVTVLDIPPTPIRTICTPTPPPGTKRPRASRRASR
jgi:hypothetical protein